MCSKMKHKLIFSVDNSIATNISIHHDLIHSCVNFCNSVLDLTILVILIWSQKEEKAVLWFASSGKYILLLYIEVKLSVIQVMNKSSSVNRNPVLIVLARFLKPLASEWVTKN